MIIVLPPEQSDLDGVACAVGYAELLRQTGTDAVPWYSEEPDGEAMFHIERAPDVTFASTQQVEESSHLVYVDACDLKLFPSKLDPENVREVIDHRFHGDPSEYFPNAKLDIEPVGAAATLVVERYKTESVIPSPESAAMLYGAIHSNTQCLKGSITDGRDVAAAKWLEEHSELQTEVVEQQFDARKQEILSDLLGSLTRERKVFGSYAITQLEFMGAKEFFHQNEEFFREEIEALTPRTVLNMVDLEAGCSLIYVHDLALRNDLATHLGTAFDNSIATIAPVILRKQLVQLLQAQKT